MAKAIASGDGRLMQKAGLENEIARLERQRAAHIDDQNDIRRRIHAARHDQQRAEDRIVAIRQDIARRTSTRGDAFAMIIGERTVSERKIGGASLRSKLRMAMLERDAREWTIGSIGGFDLTATIRRDFIGRELVPALVIQRTEYEQTIAVQDDVTALGLIARLEHALDHFEEDLETQVRQRADAVARLAGYEPRLGETFALQGELDEKLARMAEIEADLAKTDSILADDQPDLTEGDGITQAA